MEIHRGKGIHGKRKKEVASFVILILIVLAGLKLAKPKQSFQEVRINETRFFVIEKNTTDVVVVLHGGFGSKSATISELAKYSKFNCTVAAVDYRNSAFGQEDLEDTLKTIDFFLKQNRSVIVIGKSHGGYLALLACEKRKCKAVVDIAGPTDLVTLGDFSPRILAVSAVFSPLVYKTIQMCSGLPYEVPECYEKISPISYFENLSEPIMIVHGTRDSIVPIQQAYELELLLNSSGKKYETYYPNATHMTIDELPTTLKRISRFVGNNSECSYLD